MVNVAGQKAIKSKSSNAGADMPRFAPQNWLKPFISNDLEVALKNPIFFQPPTGQTGYGYPAEVLVDICDATISRMVGKHLTYKGLVHA